MEEKQVLIVNAGSTSLKFRLYRMPAEERILGAEIERVGSERALFRLATADHREEQNPLTVPDYRTGLEIFIAAVEKATEKPLQPDLIGFKTVLANGYFGVHPVTDDLKSAMRDWQDVAPAHNGPYLAAMETLQERWPDTPQVAVFETDFHRTVPEARRLYGLPFDWVEDYGVRRYGYHGSSHRYISETIRSRYDDASHIISCHLGGSGSISAILEGASIDNSFGFSLQTGVLHNNRVGELDAFVVPFLLHRGQTLETIERRLTEESGLFGLSGLSGDLRDIEEQLDLNPRANLAFEVYVEHVLREVGRAYAVLGGLTDFAFTGGIGENSRLLRARVVERLAHLGLQLDEAKNIDPPADGRIEAGPIRIHVLATNEEVIVARETYQCPLS